MVAAAAVVRGERVEWTELVVVAAAAFVAGAVAAGACAPAGIAVVACSGAVAAAGAGDPAVVLNTLFYVGFVPLVGLLGMGWVIETRGRKIPD